MTPSAWARRLSASGGSQEPVASKCARRAGSERIASARVVISNVSALPPLSGWVFLLRLRKATLMSFGVAPRPTPSSA